MIIAGALSVALGSPVGVRAQAAADRVPLLDVPYIPQEEALCGGAAAAMVMRFWGAKDVYPDEFGTLVRSDLQGIRGEDLVQALRDRDWQAVALAADGDLVKAQLAERRPMIALIEDVPGRFHFVVIVGWTGNDVILHDPARTPFRKMDARRFSEVWAAANRWTLLVLPPLSGVTQFPDHREATEPHRLNTLGNCSGLVAEGVRLATAERLSDARTVLELSTRLCPAAPDGWRELAGLHALEGQWKDAAVRARDALARDPGDQHAARILATSEFLDGDRERALDAWNQLGEPVIDLVNIRGLERTRYSVLTNALGLEPRTLLTGGSLRLARRRLAEVPSVGGSHVTFSPDENARTQVDVAVSERSTGPSGVVGWASTGARALTDRELVVPIASPTGGGELIVASWRWWEHRQRVEMRVSAPSATRVLGRVWSVAAFTEQQTYGSNHAVEERRTGAALAASDWFSDRVRWEIGLGLDRWSDRRLAASLRSQLRAQMLGDRFVVDFRASVYGGGVRTAGAALRSEWQSSTTPEGQVWLARAGVDATGVGAPQALWPGAGTGHGRDILLRAHQLLTGGSIADGVFGRRVFHGGGEWRRWYQVLGGALRLGPAVFVDSARAARGMSDSDPRAHVDAGAGLRVAIRGGGTVRVDLARGLRDGAVALSIGWAR